ncbi:malate dehydrogenase (quinone) [Gulosibacter chungangensis]|uniref:Probable malate:quinone oxidoreductase n=1 Tax=Gulosibacter chungangensis TaxID=979746 RepID=A0A7J5BF18_9MICO|nr:malate dehydrogenase (quinone) [Gulosibacter chungangensis]KAB1644851.1 malate dehydrogenase (quinone) [Gulosibacter chungangensis]
MTNPKIYDAVLIGGGVMSATLATLLNEFEPDWSIKIIERLDDVAQESSDPWNNAGTGHTAFCELNYTPEKDGKIDITKALAINEQFQISRQLWATLVQRGDLPEPSKFINPVPHMTFVTGAGNVDFLRRRYELLKDQPLFSTMEYSEDPAKIFEWAPSLMVGRAKDEVFAATYVPQGTDVDFGSLTRLLIQNTIEKGTVVRLGTEVIDLRQRPDAIWQVATQVRSGANKGQKNVTHARFVFVGAGGGALNLLQKSGIDEVNGFGGFPISGQFFRTDNPEVVAKHQAKVYSKAAVGAPPMSVPHLDTRVVNGKKALMFGPYAGFNTKYLKQGSLLDMFKALRPGNIPTYLGVGATNFDLVSYLVGQLAASDAKKFEEVLQFMPEAKREDWRLITAGQRVQVMKKDANGKAVLQMGTEVVAKADGSIAGLLGASPGASVAPEVMIKLALRCFPEKSAEWEKKIKALVPEYGKKLNDDAELAKRVQNENAEVLGITRIP